MRFKAQAKRTWLVWLIMAHGDMTGEGLEVSSRVSGYGPVSTAEGQGEPQGHRERYDHFAWMGTQTVVCNMGLAYFGMRASTVTGCVE